MECSIYKNPERNGEEEPTTPNLLKKNEKNVDQMCSRCKQLHDTEVNIVKDAWRGKCRQDVDACQKRNRTYQKNLELSLRKIEAERNELKKELIETREQLEDAKKQLDDRGMAEQQFQAYLQRVQAIVDKNKAYRDEAGQLIDSMFSDCRQLQSENRRLSNSLADLKTRQYSGATIVDLSERINEIEQIKKQLKHAITLAQAFVKQSQQNEGETTMKTESPQIQEHAKIECGVGSNSPPSLTQENDEEEDGEITFLCIKNDNPRPITPEQPKSGKRICLKRRQNDFNIENIGTEDKRRKLVRASSSDYIMDFEKLLGMRADDPITELLERYIASTPFPYQILDEELDDFRRMLLDYALTYIQDKWRNLE